MEHRAALGELNARFAWALDLKDYDVLEDLFTPALHYASAGKEYFDIASLIASFRARTGVRTTRHGLGNQLFESTGDSTATGRGSWHTFASNAEPARGVEIYQVADFRDSYVLAGGTWRIRERLIVPVFRSPELAPAAAGPVQGKETP